MQFLAVRSDCRPPRSLALNYEYKLSVECCSCKVIYKLMAPLLEAEWDFLQVQDQWLNCHLARVCPDHPDYFLTPDLSEAPH